MSIEALVTLRLFGDPEERTSAKGHTYAKGEARSMARRRPSGTTPTPRSSTSSRSTRARPRSVDAGGIGRHHRRDRALQMRSYTDKAGKERPRARASRRAVLTPYQCAQRKAAARGDRRAADSAASGTTATRTTHTPRTGGPARGVARRHPAVVARCKRSSGLSARPISLSATLRSATTPTRRASGSVRIAGCGFTFRGLVGGRVPEVCVWQLASTQPARRASRSSAT